MQVKDAQPPDDVSVRLGVLCEGHVAVRARRNWLLVARPTTARLSHFLPDLVTELVVVVRLAQ